MNSFNWRRNTEDSKKYGLIITVTTIRIFFVLKTRNVKPLKASLNTMDMMKLIGGIRRGVLVKDYTVYKTWIKKKKKNEWHSEQYQNCMAPGSYKTSLFLNG